MFPSLGYFKTVYCPENCDRPNCFFRHEKAKKTSSNLIEDIDKKINKLKSDITKHTAGLSTNAPIKYVPSKTVGPSKSACGSSILSRNKNLVYDVSKPKIQNDMEYDPMVNYNAKEFLSSSTNGVKRPSSDYEDENDRTLPVKKMIKPLEDDLFGCSDDLDEEDGLTIDVQEDEDLFSTGTETESQDDITEEEADNKSKEEPKKHNDNDSSKTSTSKDKKSTVDSNKTSSITKSNDSIKFSKNEGNLQTTKSKVINKVKKKDKKSSKDKDLNSSSLKSKKHKKVNELVKGKSEKAKNGSKLKSKKKSTTVAKKKEVDVKKYVSQKEIEKLDKELSGENIYNECLMLFNEYENKANKKSKKLNKESEQKKVDQHPSNSTESSSAADDVTSDNKEFPTSSTTGIKRRVAHVGANTSAVSTQRSLVRRIKRSTPAQKMLARFQELQQQSLGNVDLKNKTNSTLPGAKRIAHASGKTMPVISKDALKKYRLNALNNVATSSKSPFSVNMKTAVKTNANVKQEKSRTAHQVNTNNKVISAPRITIDRHSKVPTNVRQKCVIMIWNEYLRITNNDRAKAYELTVTEEEQCKKKSNSKIVYMGVCANAIKKLKTLPVIRDKKNTSKIIKNLTEKKSNITTIGIHSLSVDDEMNLYEKLCHYIMTEEQMEENCYPLSGILPGQASIQNLKPLPKVSTPDARICCRCGQEFILSESGCFKHDTQCVYHWGRAYNTKIGHHYEKRYSCCSENIGAPGCVISDVHVHQDNKHDLKGFVKTMAKSPDHDTSPGIFALDCEMCYTVVGLELTRVSVVNYKCEVVYDTFIKPAGRVLDYNTRWSGITEEDLKNCKVTIRDVQAVFLSKFSSETIFIGHSLESDLVALRIIHSCVIDTAIVFPHKLGFPFKRALRTLMSEYLGIVIQAGASDGHDSHEDAAACMKLMLWRVSEDSKIKGKLT